MQPNILTREQLNLNNMLELLIIRVIYEHLANMQI